MKSGEYFRDYQCAKSTPRWRDLLAKSHASVDSIRPAVIRRCSNRDQLPERASLGSRERQLLRYSCLGRSDYGRVRTRQRDRRKAESASILEACCWLSTA